jgi:hypothetical protein
MPTRSLVVSDDYQTVLNHLMSDLHGPAPPERRLKPMPLSIAVVAASIGFGSVIWPAQADIAKPLTIAVLNDKTSVFSDAGGVGSVVAAQLAIDNAGGKVRDQPIILQGPDHQNKTDVGVTIARNFYDQQGGDALFDIGHSAISRGLRSEEPGRAA